MSALFKYRNPGKLAMIEYSIGQHYGQEKFWQLRLLLQDTYQMLFRSEL
jgi:hypothetical protein